MFRCLKTQTEQQSIASDKPKPFTTRKTPISMYKVISFLLLVSSLSVAAKAAQREPDFEIPKTHIEVHVGRPDAVPKPEMLPDEVQQPAKKTKPDDPIEALRYEVETLRDEIRMLQATLDLMINKIMSDLREENILLRKEMQRLNNMQEHYGLPDMAAIPRPGIQLIDEILGEEIPLENEPPPEEEYYTDEEFTFTPLHQWGRTPEMAEELGDGASSLLGMVGVVPGHSRREDIEDLGRELRDEYDTYDNINIEVFDDMAVAEEFIEAQTGDPNRRVLSISKHSSEGRDIILYLHNGEAHEVLRETN